MEIRKIKGDDKQLLIEIPGESFTLTSPLEEELWSDPSVSEAAQIREHPYLSEPRIWVKVSSCTAIKALQKASNNLLKKINEFKEKFKKAI